MLLYIHACMHTYIHTYTHTQRSIYIYIYVYIYIYIHTYIKAEVDQPIKDAMGAGTVGAPDGSRAFHGAIRDAGKPNLWIQKPTVLRVLPSN